MQSMCSHQAERTAEEIDLNRVVEVYNGLLGKKILQDALSMCTVPRVELGKHQNREQLSNEKAKQHKYNLKAHKHDLKAKTALIA